MRQPLTTSENLTNVHHCRLLSRATNSSQVACYQRLTTQPIEPGRVAKKSKGGENSPFRPIREATPPRNSLTHNTFRKPQTFANAKTLPLDKKSGEHLTPSRPVPSPESPAPNLPAISVIDGASPYFRAYLLQWCHATDSAQFPRFLTPFAPLHAL